MFKSIYDFTKVFSFLFLLTGLFFIFKEAYITAFIMMLTFFAVKLADSDYAFELLRLKNHSGFVVTLTFIFIFLNTGLLIHEMKYSPYFYQFSTREKEIYADYENQLFNNMKSCLDYHNYMMKVVNQNLEVNPQYEEQSNKICLDTVAKIEDMQVPSGLTNVINELSVQLKKDFRALALSLSNFHYKEQNRTYAIDKIKETNTKIVENILKIRKIMRIEQDLKEDRRNFLLL